MYELHWSVQFDFRWSDSPVHHLSVCCIFSLCECSAAHHWWFNLCDWFTDAHRWDIHETMSDTVTVGRSLVESVLRLCFRKQFTCALTWSFGLKPTDGTLFVEMSVHSFDEWLVWSETSLSPQVPCSWTTVRFQHHETLWKSIPEYLKTLSDLLSPSVS